MQIRRTHKTSLGVLVAAALLLGTLSTPLAASPTSPDDPKVTILNKDRVYYPTVIKKDAAYKKPATLVSSTVYDGISEWKEIKRKKLTEKDAEYHLLLNAATKKFKKAVKAVRVAGSYDIIAEKGAIKCENVKAKDVTKDVVKSLPKKK